MDKISPMNTKDTLLLNRDNLDTNDYWILVSDDCVNISKQKDGESIAQLVRIPKKDFNKFVRWYIKDQKISPRKNK